MNLFLSDLRPPSFVLGDLLETGDLERAFKGSCLDSWSMIPHPVDDPRGLPSRRSSPLP